MRHHVQRSVTHPCALLKKVRAPATHTTRERMEDFPSSPLCELGPTESGSPRQDYAFLSAHTSPQKPVETRKRKRAEGCGLPPLPQPPPQAYTPERVGVLVCEHRLTGVKRPRGREDRNKQKDRCIMHAVVQPSTDEATLARIANRLRVSKLAGSSISEKLLQAQARGQYREVHKLPQLALNADNKTVVLVNGYDADRCCLTSTLAWNLETRIVDRFSEPMALHEIHDQLRVRPDWSVGTSDLYPWNKKYGVAVLDRVTSYVDTSTCRQFFNDSSSPPLSHMVEAPIGMLGHRNDGFI